MNFESQKFFIILMDFFSIPLPGALLTYLLMGSWRRFAKHRMGGWGKSGR